jgi:hypothetical protein
MGNVGATVRQKSPSPKFDVMVALCSRPLPNSDKHLLPR